MLAEDNTAVFRRICDTVDAGEDLLEILLPYLDLLIAAGVDFNHQHLQEAIEANILYLEAACQATLGYAGLLAVQKKRFGSRIHATACLTKALIERWEPRADWQKLAPLAANARYMSPYEEAYRLLLEIKQSGGEMPMNLEELEPLSDAEIEQRLNTLRQYKERLPKK